MKTLKILPFLVLLLAAPLAVAQTPIPAFSPLNASAYILIDHRTNAVIVEYNADQQVEPASLTKLMSAYVVFQTLRDGRVRATDLAPISRAARNAATGGSSMFVREGARVPLMDLLRGMIVVSGNDASVALAEYVAGSEPAFADLMNHYAAQIGMTGSHFVNSHGLSAPGHLTTARDMALLMQAIIRDFPEYYSLYSETSYTTDRAYTGQDTISQNNRNPLLGADGVDGGKTGYTTAAGYCLVASALNSGMRLISVVMGMASEQARLTGARALLSHGFRWYETYQVQSVSDVVATPRVWKGAAQNVTLGVASDLWATIPRGQSGQLRIDPVLPAVVTAPLTQGQTVGELRVTLNGKEVARAPLVAQRAVARGGWLTRLRDTVLLWLR